MSRGNYDIFKKSLFIPFVTMKYMYMYVFCKMKYLRYFLVLKFYHFKDKCMGKNLHLSFISVNQEENSGKISFSNISSFLNQINYFLE